MLLNFSFENFRSFKELTEFSMVATEASGEDISQHLSYDEDKLIRVGNPPFEALSVTAIYGANAFGKSSFVDALQLIQRLVLEPIEEGEEIPVSPFFMDPKTKKMPTSFDLNILSGKNEYKIFIKLSRSKIIEERVSMVKGDSKEDLYHRKEKSLLHHKPCGNGKSNLGEKINYALESCNSNALLLSSQMLQKVDEFIPIHEWFSENLLILSNDTKFVCVNDSDNLAHQIGKALRLLDTGIETIQMIPSGLDKVSLTQDYINDLQKKLKPNKAVYFENPYGEIFKAAVADGEIFVDLISIVKKDCKANKFNVDVRDESNGIHRLLKILPAFLQLDKNDQQMVMIVDEFDKSLHFETVLRLVRYHINNVFHGCNSQFIFTTHDINLIDNHILRNDEIWVVQKDRDGVSKMVYLDEYEKVETNMDLRQMYVADHFGGNPNIFLLSSAQLGETGNELKA